MVAETWYIIYLLKCEKLTSRNKDLLSNAKFQLVNKLNLSIHTKHAQETQITDCQDQKINVFDEMTIGQQ